MVKSSKRVGQRLGRGSDSARAAKRFARGAGNAGEAIGDALKRSNVPGGKAARLDIGPDADPQLARANEKLSDLLIKCFAAGTPILTPDGHKPIEELVPGDWVLSAPEDNPEAVPEPKMVQQAFGSTKSVMTLVVNGQVPVAGFGHRHLELELTGDHFLPKNFVPQIFLPFSRRTSPLSRKFRLDWAHREIEDFLAGTGFSSEEFSC